MQHGLLCKPSRFAEICCSLFRDGKGKLLFGIFQNTAISVSDYSNRADKDSELGRICVMHERYGICIVLYSFSGKT